MKRGGGGGREGGLLSDQPPSSLLPPPRTHRTTSVDGRRERARGRLNKPCWRRFSPSLFSLLTEKEGENLKGFAIFFLYHQHQPLWFFTGMQQLPVFSYEFLLLSSSTAVLSLSFLLVSFSARAVTDGGQKQ